MFVIITGVLFICSVFKCDYIVLLCPQW